MDTVTEVTEADRKQQIENVLSLMEQGISERKACETVGISRSTFRTTALRHEAGDQYARALSELAHDQANKIEVVISEVRTGKITPDIARLEIDARKWFASKFLPKRYGDRTQTDITTGDKPLESLTLTPEKADKFAQFLAQETKQQG